MKLAGVLFLICCLAARSAFADDTNLTLTVDGVTYSNVTFGTVTPVSVSFRHSTGAATVPLQKLPPEFQRQLGYDPQKATAWLQGRERQKLERNRQDAIAQKQPPPLREIDGKIYDFSAVIEWVKHESAYVSAVQTEQTWSQWNARNNPQGLALPGGGPHYTEAEKNGSAIYLAGEKKWHGYVVRGEVVQVLSGGVLFGGSGAVQGFLKHHPDQSSLVDGAMVNVLAMPVGKFPYTTTIGAKATVKAYDFGTKPTWKQSQQIVLLPPLSE